MKVQPIHKNFQIFTKGSQGAGAYDIYMPEAGVVFKDTTTKVPLGFAAEVPEGYVALILPRSGVGSKHGLELNNTCGVIDADYRGEWIANLKVKAYPSYEWAAGDRLLQFLLVPVLSVGFEIVENLSETTRNAGGFGSSGQ